MVAKTFSCCFLLFLSPAIILSTATDTCESVGEICRQYEFSTIEELREKLENDEELFKYVSKQLENNMKVNINSALTTPTTLLTQNGFYKECNGLWYKYFKKPKTYEIADDKCRKYNGQLISTGYRDFDIRRSLLGLIHGGNTTLDSEFWIGLRRSNTNTSLWIWKDGIQTTNTSDMWMDKEPNNSDNHEFCGMNKPSTSGNKTVNDVRCDKKFAYFCEVEIK
ncbi:C-type lectin-like [Styela clava]